jgi:hypothetical protein
MTSLRLLVAVGGVFALGWTGTACTTGSADDGTGGYAAHAAGGGGGSATGGSAGDDGGAAAGGSAGSETGGAGGDLPDSGTGGDDASTGGTGGDVQDASVDAPDGCTPIVLLGIQQYPTNPNTVLFSYYAPGTGSSAPDQVWIEWYPASGQTMAAGTFDLAQAPDDNYATCVHCVRGAEDLVGTDATKTYFPESGTLILQSIHEPLDGQSKGALVNVKLVEVTLDPNTSQSTPVANGSCLYISSASWDLLAKPIDTPCNNAEDCGDPLHLICDPSTATCQPGQCDSHDACKNQSDACIAQIANASIGACYPGCVPFSTTNVCDANFECVNASWDQSAGFCNARGTHAVGDPCARIDLSTDCVAGSVCKNIGSDVDPDFRCVQQCNYFSAGTTRACTDPNDTCFPGGVCLETASQQVDPAGFGEVCSILDYVSCGLNAVTGIAEGVCDDYFSPGVYRCYRFCRMGNDADCHGSGACTDAQWDNGLGDCK